MVAFDGSTEVSSVDSAIDNEKRAPDSAMENKVAMDERSREETTTTEKIEGTTEAVVESSSSQSQQDQEQGNGEEEEYPASWRLALITIALCLSVFCMALVRAVWVSWFR
jgi:hypothetical protein